MKISLLKCSFGRDAKNQIIKAHERSAEGALASLETFYYGFNNKDMDTFRSIWCMHDLIQLNNPVGGIVRGMIAIEELYRKIFQGPADVWVKFSDIVCYCSDEIVVFAGTETGELSNEHKIIPLKFRTTRVFGYDANDERWCQLHHHGSIDDANLLYQYQNAVNETAAVEY